MRSLRLRKLRCIGNLFRFDRCSRIVDALHAFDDNAIAAAESAFDDALPVDIAAQLEIATLGAVVLADDVDIAAILIGEHGFIVDQQGIRVMTAHVKVCAELPTRTRARIVPVAGSSRLLRKSTVPSCGKPISFVSAICTASVELHAS